MKQVSLWHKIEEFDFEWIEEPKSCSFYLPDPKIRKAMIIFFNNQVGKRKTILTMTGNF